MVEEQWKNNELKYMRDFKCNNVTDLVIEPTYCLQPREQS